MERIINVGIIDDDSSKITQIMTRLKYGVENSVQFKKNKYRSVTLEPIEIPIDFELQDMVKFIKEKEIVCVLVDYNLTSYANKNFTGVEFAKNLEEAFFDFPIFILTAYEDELFEQEIFNAYQVFNFSRYLDEEKERIELNFKLIEQVIKREKQIDLWNDEIKRLLPSAGKSSEIDSRILELDNLLEKSIDGENTFSPYVKERMSFDKISDLITKIDKLLEDE